MAVMITDLRGCSPDEYPLYFFDANVWLAVLKHTGSQPLRKYEQDYVDFFEAIITLHTHPPKLQKRLKHLPRLVLTGLLLSEVINAYMRQVAFKAYQITNTGTEFKRDYRSSADYQQQLRTITSDIQQYKDYIELLDDDFAATDPFGMLSLMQASPGQYDFNDLYYYRHLRGKSIAIVTHDGDFTFPDFLTLTVNPGLLQKAR